MSPKIPPSQASYVTGSQSNFYTEKFEELKNNGFNIHNQRASILLAIKKDSEKPADQSMHLDTATFRPISHHDLWGKDVNIIIRATIPAPHPAIYRGK